MKTIKPSVLPSSHGVTGPALPDHLEDDPAPYTRLWLEARARELAAFQAQLAARSETTRGAGPHQHEPTTCAECGGIGWLVVTVDGDRRSVRCACRTGRPPAAPEVPVAFQTARLENYLEHPGNRAAIQAAHHWLASDAGDLYFCGGLGVGKSRLACSLLNEMHVARRGSTLFVSVPYLMLLQRQAIDDGAKKPAANRAIDVAIEADILCLDDVAGAEKSTDWLRITLLPIYVQRLAHRKRTLWTSNLDLDALASQEVLGDDRLTSRIAGELPGGNVVRISGEDLRLKRARAAGRGRLALWRKGDAEETTE